MTPPAPFICRKSGFLPPDNGHEVFWAAYGNPNGIPLLLIHGGFNNILDPARLGALNPATHNIIILHQRGMGRSTPRAARTHNNLKTNRDDIERLRTHLNIKKWSILSWSAGTVLMTAYAAKYPHRCQQLTAYAPYFGSNDDYAIIHKQDPGLAAKYFAFHNAKNGADIVRSVFNKAAHPDKKVRLKSAFNAAALWDPDLDEQSFYKSKTPAGWEDYFRTYLLGAQLDYELHTTHKNFLAQKPVTIPTILIYGTADLWAAPHAYAKEVFPHAKIIKIPSAGHDIHDEKVQNFLKNRPQKGVNLTL